MNRPSLRPVKDVAPRQSPKAAEPVLPAAAYQPTPQEAAAVEAFEAARAIRPPVPLVKIEIDGEGKHYVGVEHPDSVTGGRVMAQAFATTSEEFFRGVLSSVVDGTSRNHLADADKVNFTMAFVGGMEPRDQMEALLLTQMASIHLATMTATRKLNNADTVERQSAYSNSVAKLARTFAAQAAALKAYRSTGQQTVTVQHQHVTVSDGGQAIVGDVHHGGGGGQRKNPEASS